MKSDLEFRHIVEQEEGLARAFESEISRDREKLLDYYNQQPFGDEIEGQSQVVTSDVSDVVETILPSLMRIFTGPLNVAVFEADRPEYEEEAKQKTYYANYVFNRQNEGTLCLYNFFKDALLQFTGIMKVTWDDSEEARYETYRGLDEIERQKLELDPNSEIISDDGEMIEVKVINSTGRVRFDNIPPNEFLINKDARDYRRPRFIGHRTPKTRSELIEMGFDKKTVQGLASDVHADQDRESEARNYNLEYQVGSGSDPANDLIYLGEYYIRIDADEDGIAELYQVFKADNVILEKTKVDTHPFCVGIPIPLPHRAIGTCPAAQVADIQLIKSTLVRQLLNNIYQSNHARTVVNDRVELDDLLTPRAGGIVRINDDGPVGDSLMPLTVQPIIGEILTAIEYEDTAREIRTGVTRYNQGLGSETLNKTATGFRGIMEASQQRIELIARLMADGGVRDIFEKIIELASKYQTDTHYIKVMGQPMQIDPTAWRASMHCRIDVGVGSGDRQEKIMNLNYLLQLQKEMQQTGSLLVDSQKIYNTVSKLITETGLKDANRYFNDPSQEESTLLAQNEQLLLMVQQLQQQVQNPLAEVEQIKAQAKLADTQSKNEHDLQKMMIQMKNDNQKFSEEMLARLTELELKYQQNVPGAAV